MNTGVRSGWRKGAGSGLIHVQDQKASGTAGGTFTSGAWQKRDLNTVLTNELEAVLLASEITGLPAGVYEVEAFCPAYRVDRHQARLYNVTHAVALPPLSQPHYSNAGSDYATNFVVVRGRFTLTATSTVRLEHRCQTTGTTTGFGIPGSFGTEVYADLQIRFLGT